jgi:lipopolysaccharide/colanic/teichoic acid biosynthesis glycosyltransferase
MQNNVAVADMVDVKKNLYYFLKRGFDIVVSLVALILLSPLFLAVIIAIKLEDRGKAIFTQERIGLGGTTFKLYKFRSMVLNADEILMEILKDETSDLAKEYILNKKFREDPRITKVGKFIRRTSIDELPQLVNILKGEMSLIGNRPYLPREKEDMKPYYYDIVKTKPGLTGYWQVNGRSNTTFKHRCKLEAEYSNNMSFRMDFKIFFKTFIVLFKGM